MDKCPKCKSDFKSLGLLRYPAEGDRIAETYEFACGSFHELVGDEWEFRQTDGCEIAKLSRDLDAANKENAALTAEVERLRKLVELDRLAPAPAEAKKRLGEYMAVKSSLRELYAAMHRYEDAADCDAPWEHKAMMGRAAKVLLEIDSRDAPAESQEQVIASVSDPTFRPHVTAEAKYAGPRQEVNPYLDYLFHKPECGCELCIQWHEDFPGES